MDRKKVDSKKSNKLSGRKDKASTAEKKRNELLWLHNPQIQYRLSDPTFVNMAWTLLPSRISSVRNITTFKAVPSKPHMAFFKPRAQVERKLYADGTLMAVCRRDGTGSVYYPDGRVAMRQLQAGRCTRLVVKWPGNKDTRTGQLRKPGVCAIFDSLGNAVVYDEDAKVRLLLNQQQGMLVDTPNGRPIKWSWLVGSDHAQTVGASCNEDELSTSQYDTSVVTVNDAPPRGSQTKLNKDDKRKSREMKARQNSIPPEKAKDIRKKQRVSVYQAYESEGEVCPTVSFNGLVADVGAEIACLKALKKQCVKGRATEIKPVVLKLNAHLALRIIDQATVSLVFRVRKQTMRLELGVIVDTSAQTRVDKMDASKVGPGHVVNYFEQFPRVSLTKVLHTVERQRARAHKRQTNAWKVI